MTTLLDRADPACLARTLSGFAHPDRIRLARAVLLGANTHHLLSQAVKMKTGPLYHHLRELERSGLLARVTRNTYSLTDFGRTVLFVVAVLGMEVDGRGKSIWTTRRFAGTSRKQKAVDKVIKQRRRRKRDGGRK